MSKLITLFAVLLILVGVVLVAVPRQEAGGTRGLAPQGIEVPGILVTVRDIADEVQAPLSILFGLISLYWNRKTYLKQKGG